jgi:rhodanese-related sulfurtransferase
MNLLIKSSVFALFSLAASAFAADAVKSPKPAIARICTSCHSSESGSLRGLFDHVAFKAKTLQIKIDDSVELLKFDEDELKVTTSEGKSGDGELLRKTRKGHEVKIEFTEKNGIKTATRFIEKPPAKVSQEMLISTEELEKLVAMGPSKGKYFLYDARPVLRYQEGAIPTAANIPYSSFDMMTENLPKDKNAHIIYYDTGPDCVLSTSSAAKAKKLGYTNIRIYREGIPGWQARNYGVLSPSFLNEAWLDKGIPHVLLDVRQPAVAAKGHIKGAVAYPVAQLTKLEKSLPPKDKNPPVIIYDARGGREAERVATRLIKSGYTNIMILQGGFEDWQTAKYEIVQGRLAASASYTPQPRPGEIAVAEFKRYAVELPADVVILDVRNEDELKAGMLKNAINISVEDLKAKAAAIPKDKLIVTQCATGVRAEMAYHTLKELGYSRIGFLNAKVTFNKDGSYEITKD